MKTTAAILSLACLLGVVSACTDFNEFDITGPTVNVSELTIPVSPTDTVIVITCGEKWDIAEVPEWITLGKISASHEEEAADNKWYKNPKWEVHFTVSGNTGKGRIGSLVFSSASGSAEVKIIQEGNNGEVPIVPVIPVAEAVDLGLSVQWASFNVGATRPEEPGYYFAWGETEPKSVYSWEAYKYRLTGDTGDDVTFSKYNSNSERGTVDKKTRLTLSDDAAHANWGDGWRMPVYLEIKELLEQCNWEWTTQDGIEGNRVTSKINGNSIFLPATGYRNNADLSSEESGSYWVSALYLSMVTAYTLHSAKDKTGVGVLPRCYGLPVRPVYDETPLSVSEVQLDYSSLRLYYGKSQQLNAVVLPETAIDKTVNWSSSDPSVASVDETGKVHAIKAGKATITVTTADGGKTATCLVTVFETMPVASTVDLGLSVKWASFNLGATKPEEYGEYFAWGETEPKDEYTWSSYVFWISGTINNDIVFKKYNVQEGHGVIDYNTVLDLEDDAANVHWHSNWRIPTYAELQELKQNCTWTWQENHNDTGVNGYLVTSNIEKYTDKSIFLPAGGYWSSAKASSVNSVGYYWSSEINWNSVYGSKSLYCKEGSIVTTWETRFTGRNIRPVVGTPTLVSEVKLDQSELSLNIGETRTLNAFVLPETVKDQSIQWKSNNPAVVSVNGGKITALMGGRATITVTTIKGEKSATCKVTVSSNASVGKAIDMGLSVKWASWNIGAGKEEDYGEYYAWGETSPKDSYVFSTYSFWESGTSVDDYKFNKYNANDKKTVLDLSDDAARANWGSSWRMPTIEEWEELKDDSKCTWVWKNDYNGTGVNGYLVTSNKTKKTIFLPAAGYKGYTSFDIYSLGQLYYWSSTLYTEKLYEAREFWCTETYKSTSSTGYRSGGHTIRPVTK